MFTDMGGALLLCPHSLSFSSAMDATRSWHKDWNKLVLYDAKGAVTFELSRSSAVGYRT